MTVAPTMVWMAVFRQRATAAPQQPAATLPPPPTTPIRPHQHPGRAPAFGTAAYKAWLLRMAGEQQ